MKSPFPGMDPYIEACGLWSSFHDNLIGDLERELANRVPEHYFVRLGTRSYLVPDAEATGNSSGHSNSASSRSRSRPEKVQSRTAKSSARKTATLEPPLQMFAPLDMEQREIFIEILQVRPERRIVTGIEVLSPANKLPGTPGWDEYLRKRRSYLNGDASLVEIDLLRNGHRMPMREPWPNSPCYIMVSRREQVPRCQVWRGFAERPLSRLAVPLGPGDSDIEFNLQLLIDVIYERAQFASLIDYRRPVSPPLSSSEKKLLARVPKRRPARRQAKK
jgi:hypothetical protein